jgi:hypothetical protein
MLLAGEREDGTLTFLDLLPSLRRRLWAAKCLTGAALVLSQAAVLGVALVGFTATAGIADAIPALIVLPVAALMGLGWGLWFSAEGSTVLTVVGLAVGGQFLAYLCVVAALVLLDTAFGPIQSDVALAIAGAGNAALTALAFGGSARAFCRIDRGRRGADLPRQWTDRPGALLWLEWRSARRLALILGLSSMAAGLLSLRNGLVLWPIFSLLAGVLCGVTVFSGDRVGGAFRFLGDQRLPPGRVWLIKVSLRLTLAVAAALILLLPSLVRALYVLERHPRPGGTRPLLTWLFGDALVGELAPTGVYLTLGLLHGFGFGTLCGLLCRRTLVAAVLALGLSLPVAGIWLPSLLGGGLRLWQAAGVPLLALAASRVLLPAWTAGRLERKARSLAAIGTLGVSALWLVAALGWRVLEVPDLPEGFNMAEFMAGLPAPDQEDAGSLTRQACEGVLARQRALGTERKTPLPFTDNPDAFQTDYRIQCEGVLEVGWRAGDAWLAEWLDRLFDAPWPGQLARAAEMPPGVVEDPRRLALTRPLRMGTIAEWMSFYLSAHGLLQQAQGDPAAFVADLRAGLALVRNLRHDTVPSMVVAARRVEDTLLKGLDRWLESLAGRPDLLRQVLHLLLHHEAETGAPTRSREAQFLVVQTTMEQPEDWLTHQLIQHPAKAEPATAAAVAVAWRVPWERARRQRLLRLLFPDEGGQPGEGVGPGPVDAAPAGGRACDR